LAATGPVGGWTIKPLVRNEGRPGNLIESIFLASVASRERIYSF